MEILKGLNDNKRPAIFLNGDWLSLCIINQYEKRLPNDLATIIGELRTYQTVAGSMRGGLHHPQWLSRLAEFSRAYKGGVIGKLPICSSGSASNEPIFGQG